MILLFFSILSPTPQISREQIILAVNYGATENLLLRLPLFRLRFDRVRKEPWPLTGDSNMSCHSVLQILSRQIENRLIIVHKLFVYIGNDRGDMCKGKRICHEIDGFGRYTQWKGETKKETSINRIHLCIASGRNKSRWLSQKRIYCIHALSYLRSFFFLLLPLLVAVWSSWKSAKISPTASAWSRWKW